MKIATICLLLALALGLPGRGAEPEKPPACPLRTKVFKIPVGFLSQPPPELPGQPTPELPAAARRLEAMDYFTAAGIEFPPGSEVFFEPATSRLVVHAPGDVIARVTALVEEALFPPSRQVRVTVAVTEFSLPKAEPLTSLTYERARTLAGGSWKTIESSSLLGKSGHKSSGLSAIARSTPEPSPAKGRATPANATPEWCSEEFEIEPQIGPEETGEIALEFRFNRRQPAGASPKRFDVTENVMLKNEEPTLLRATALPATAGAKTTTVRALIVRAAVVDARGVRPPPRPEPPPPSHHP